MEATFIFRSGAAACYQISQLIYQGYRTHQTDEGIKSETFQRTLLLSSCAVIVLIVHDKLFQRPFTRYWVFFDRLASTIIPLVVAIELFREIVDTNRKIYDPSSDSVGQPFMYQCFAITGSFLLLFTAKLMQPDIPVIRHAPVPPRVRVWTREEERNRETWQRLARM